MSDKFEEILSRLSDHYVGHQVMYKSILEAMERLVSNLQGDQLEERVHGAVETYLPDNLPEGVDDSIKLHLKEFTKEELQELRDDSEQANGRSYEAFKLLNQKLVVIERTLDHLGEMSEKLAEFEKVLDKLSKPMAYKRIGSLEEQGLSLGSKVDEIEDQLRRRNELFHSMLCRMENHWAEKRIKSLEDKVTLLEETSDGYEIRIKMLEKLVERMNTKLSNSIRTGILKGE